MKCARSKKEYFRTELNFMRLCCTATPADLINSFGSFLKCASRQTRGALHLLRNKSFLHQPLNKFIRWQIHHSKNKVKKMGFKMTLLKYLLFQAWELPRVPFGRPGILTILMIRTVTYAKENVFIYHCRLRSVLHGFHSFRGLCMQACNQFLHGYFKCAFHVLFQTSQEKHVFAPW